jgi:hypothetical protein
MDRRGRAGEIVDLIDLDKQRVRHVVPHRLEMRVAEQSGDVVLAAGEIIIDAEYVVALGVQPFTEVRSEKSGPAGDEYAFYDSAHLAVSLDSPASPGLDFDRKQFQPPQGTVAVVSAKAGIEERGSEASPGPPLAHRLKQGCRRTVEIARGIRAPLS